MLWFCGLTFTYICCYPVASCYLGRGCSCCICLTSWLLMLIYRVPTHSILFDPGSRLPQLHLPVHLHPHLTVVFDTDSSPHTLIPHSHTGSPLPVLTPLLRFLVVITPPRCTHTFHPVIFFRTHCRFAPGPYPHTYTGRFINLGSHHAT